MADNASCDNKNIHDNITNIIFVWISSLILHLFILFYFKQAISVHDK